MHTARRSPLPLPRRRGAAAALLACLALAGCASLNRARQVRFPVDLSPLDTVQMLYCAPAADGATHVTRVELSGTGHVEVLSGRSERVVDPFWNERRHDDWDDMRTDSVMLTADQARAVVQRLVDAGLFDAGRRSHLNPESRAFLTIDAVVGRHRTRLVTDEDAFLGIYRDLIAAVRAR